MYFRNLVLFRFPFSMAAAIDLNLQAALAECQLKPVGPSELASRGFVSPFGRGEPALAHSIAAATWVTLGGEDRILPASVVNAELHKRLAAMEEAEGRKLGGRARKRLKEDVVMELLPRALVRPSRLNASIDTWDGVLYVDSSSRKAAENLVSEVRHALGSFPALPINAEVSARAVLTSWLAGEPLPAGLVIGDECELRDPIDGGAIARLQRQDMGCDEIRKHLEAGKQCTRLGLVLDDHVSFTLGEDLVIRKLKFLDGAIDQLESTERDSIHAELDARYVLMTGELRRLFQVLSGAFKFSTAEG